MALDKLDLVLVRDLFNEKCTHGSLFIDGNFECYTLEDKDRGLESGGKKVYGSTAIPNGSYKAVIDFSPRFKKDMIHILDVPGFVGIRIHAGNTSEDTEGCILVGNIRAEDAIYQSRRALDALFPKIQSAINDGAQINLEVR